MDNFIELKNISLTYNKGKDNAYQALFDVNLKIKEKEFVVIFGPSGCGKSSLLNVMAGLENPDQGVVNIEGVNLLTMKESEKVRFHCTKMGMIFQSYNLIPTLNVLNNVTLPQMLDYKKKKDREVLAMEILDRFGVKQHWEKIPTELSGGQQQRIGIARAIVNNPQIILADEPIGNLDTKSANNVMEILGNLNKKEGKTVVMVSHNPENIIWGTHIIYMKDGKVIREEFKEADQIKKVESEEQTNKSDFDRMLERLNGLSQEQIALMINPLKAKMLTESFLIPYEKNQTDIMEKNIERYLLKNINSSEFLNNLDRDMEVGGAGLDFRMAKKFFKDIGAIVEAANVFAQEDDINKKVIIILDYLGNKFDFNIGDEGRVLTLGNLIKSKLLNKIDHGRFKALLNAPVSENGAGLDKRIARKIAKEIGLFLIVSYGVKIRKADNIDDSQKREINSINK